MAEKLDINKLIADAKQKAAAAKKAAEDAAIAATKQRSENQYESAVKEALNQRKTRIEGYQKSLDEMLFNINRLAKMVGEGLATSGDKKELNRLANQYNSLVVTQDNTIKETKALSTGKGKLDTKTGKITITSTDIACDEWQADYEKYIAQFRTTQTATEGDEG